MVSILKRFAEYKQIDTSIIDTLDSYSDTEDISDYAVSAFQWACGNKIISGFTDNTLRPKQIPLVPKPQLYLIKYTV